MAYIVDSCLCSCEARHCIGECPMGAIRLEGDTIVIDEKTCLECGACMDACTRGAITSDECEVEVPISPLPKVVQ